MRWIRYFILEGVLMCVMRYRSLVVGVFLLCAQAHAANVPLQNINEADLKNFVGDLST